MGLRDIIFSAALGSSLALSGCGAIHNVLTIGDATAAKLREEGYNIEHSESCGPTALSAVLDELGEYIEPKDISRDIIEHGGKYNLFRNFFGIFSREFTKITFPEEMRSFLERNWYSTITHQYSKDETIRKFIDKGTPGIVRIGEKNSFMQHYEPLPPRIILEWEGNNWVRRRENIENHFGEDKTEVLEIYEVKPSYLKNMILNLKRKGRVLKIRIDNAFRGLGAYLAYLSDLEKMRKTY